MRRCHFVVIHIFDVFMLVAVLCAFTKPAYAYVDPGGGLFALQVISTTFVGIGFMIRRRIRSFFSSRFPGMPRKGNSEE